MSSKSLAKTLALLSLVLLPCRTTSAQILYGGLVGNVTDQSEAAVPGAKVTINHIATGTTRETTTNESGTYRFPTIAPGMYSVRVQADGFRAFNQSGVEVTANSLTRIDTHLEIGAVTEQVTVEGSAVALQTDRAEVRHELDRAQPRERADSDRPQLSDAARNAARIHTAAECPLRARQSDPLGQVFSERDQ